MFYGQTLDGVAIESEADLTGSIIFYSGASIFCTLNANLQQGSNACPPNSGIFPAGTTTVDATYTGDSTHTPATSNSIVVTVLLDTTTATLVSSLNPATFGQAVTFTASVQGNYAVGAGSVVFRDGAATLATVALDATGAATFTTNSLAVGTHPISVFYAGNSNFSPATSATFNQVILPPNQTVTGGSGFTLTVSPVPVTLGVGRTAPLLVTVTEGSGYSEPVQLSCSGLPIESSCTFIQPLIPAGGEARLRFT